MQYHSFQSPYVRNQWFPITPLQESCVLQKDTNENVATADISLPVTKWKSQGQKDKARAAM